ncbi:MAG TPA: ubiquitin-like protein Pup [Candidatus Saccharimonadales bacterium]|nr:ubiquitin-like protein Pup [Candidatus Saccharimonadales bacterium]
MAIQKRRPGRTGAPEGIIEKAPQRTPEEAAEAAERNAKLDDLLDEIDEVLEVNSAEFVKAYVQKGGQ